MRKPRRLTDEQLAPWVVSVGGGRWAVGSKEKTQAEATSLPSSLPTAHCPPPTLNWHELFGNSHPVEIEVGTGKGLFLLHAATARPETNFLGIEIVRKYQLYAATRYALRNLPNVKTACADARFVLRDLVPAASVAAVHVYFPDPWWKKRHRKRRVFTPEFAADAARAIAAGGRLYIASDVEEYFGVMTAIVRAMPAFCERPDEADRAAPQTEMGYATNFERKARAAGTAIWRAVYERTGGPVTIAPDPAGDGYGSQE